MPIKKSELHSSLWKSCDELRGGMDASQYKDYVLVLLFMKYVSDKAAGQTIHDPTCGSGSLLLKAHDEARGRTGLDLALYGQEMDNATAALARMNMILHDCPTAEIWKDNTLSSPHFKGRDGRLKTFDFVVANSPFSSKAWSNGFDPDNDLYGRFAFGMPRADWTVMRNLEISLPAIPEQTAIAAVLSDMDAEIEALEKPLAKTRALKQGMMQELLTGRTRLV